MWSKGHGGKITAIGSIATILGLCVAAQSLGWTMPWNAARANEAASKTRVLSLEERVFTIDTRLSAIEGRLDIIIIMLQKEK